MKSTDPAWLEANQKYLGALLDDLRCRLEEFLGTLGSSGSEDRLANLDTAANLRGQREEAVQAVQRTEAELPAPSAFQQLAATFQLSPFECDLLLWCAGVEIRRDLAALTAMLHDDRAAIAPSLDFALEVLREPHWDALAPSAPLRRWRLIEVTSGPSLVTSPLRIDERILHFLFGVNGLDERLRGLIEPLHVDSQPLTPSQNQLVDRMTQTAERGGDRADLPVLHVSSREMGPARAVANNVTRRLGHQLLVLRASDVPAAPAERDALALLWQRETRLAAVGLLVEVDESTSGESIRLVTALLERLSGLVMVSYREPLTLPARPVLRFAVPIPTAAERQAMWRESLGPFAANEGAWSVAANHFSLEPHVIRAAGATVLEQASALNNQKLDDLVWDASRAHARPRLDELAQRIEPAATWDDLVLPANALQTLRTIAAHVRGRTQVYDDWGFATKSARGLGISALFAGPSGTGKTMAAEVLANELRLDLYRIDLSAMVSKYIGETEKNLRRVFDAAEAGGAILLFDEADALFGKRTDVKDSHDRYANIEVSYLLQRLEAYRGLAILTSNMKQSIDSAFLRRLRFVVNFPFPDATHRGEIWRRVFPSNTPTEGLDYGKLARLNLSGGHIRNLALSAAFLAADAGEPVRMKHLLAAAQSEYAKLERPLSDAEIGGWL